MSFGPSAHLQTFCLILGVLQALGAALWILAGAGPYGSPLAGPEREYVVAFLLTGPLSALLASIVLLWRPRWGAAWLLVGGMASGVLACSFLSTDAHVLPLALVSVPMVILGTWSTRAISMAGSRGAGSGCPDAPPSRRDLRDRRVSTLLGTLLFIIALVVTYALFIVLAVHNVTGLRGAVRTDNPFMRENQDLADGVVVLLMSLLVAFITRIRQRLRLRGEAIAGMWAALFLGGLVILIR